MSTAPQIVDRARRRHYRRRFAGGPDFLRREIEDRLLDRLDDIRRPLGRVLVLGAQDGVLAARLRERPGVDMVVSADELTRPCAAGGPDVVVDEEVLPFAPDSFATVLSAMSLHWVNDLPGLLLQVRQCLMPDGLFLALFPGGETLAEARECLMAAELEISGGAGARLLPTIDVKDAGALLQRAGFALPVTDIERLTVRYREPLQLLLELRAHGGEPSAGPGRANAADPERSRLLRGALPRAFRGCQRPCAGQLRHRVDDRMEAACQPAEAAAAGQRRDQPRQGARRAGRGASGQGEARRELSAQRRLSPSTSNNRGCRSSPPLKTPIRLRPLPLAS